ncbi:hypothetical protein RY831_26805 [Noviherbaspirillum sp. CPCC 100848]|uniref:KfrA N-terminal DNA-binding domain-containing protein n=1 Tax=Noviherbaspirillum album TaxID=3080276 RepID=A0ABU6JGX5_9BURK|nr:hypothetical protein [Noviherbaspirillum sp. CPCC 100848]MEC4722775.1 hypothetical protein [Noviherbaspirillum sp. CPCC 100848]
MSRPPFHLNDDQARVLVQRLPEITARHPVSNRDHRPFVRDFLRAVHQATGQTYSPAIYRRLLDVYAPDRRPSTTTLALEKRMLDDELGDEARAGREIEQASGEELALVIERAIENALGREGPRRGGGATTADLLAVAQRDFLQERLEETERTLDDVRAQAARLAAELQAAVAVRDSLAAQLVIANATAEKQGQRVEALTKELESNRAFAMRAVDGVRGETRAWQEKYAKSQEDLQRTKQHLEYFRQIAYQRGAAIPADLRPEAAK